MNETGEVIYKYEAEFDRYFADLQKSMVLFGQDADQHEIHPQAEESTDGYPDSYDLHQDIRIFVNGVTLSSSEDNVPEDSDRTAFRYDPGSNHSLDKTAFALHSWLPANERSTFDPDHGILRSGLFADSTRKR